MDTILNELIAGTTSVRDLLIYSQAKLKKKRIHAQDFYTALDLFLYGKSSFESSEYCNLIKINEIQNLYQLKSSVLDELVQCSQIIGSQCKRSKYSLKYWFGTNVDIFYDPLLVSFNSEEADLSPLGWGSAITGQTALQLNQTNCRVHLHYGKTAIVLTRHKSKYAHFIRDRLTKVLWIEKYSNLGKFENYLFDYPLTSNEIQCLRSFGVHGAIQHIESKFTKVEGKVCVFEVSSGNTLLPYLHDYLTNENSDKHPIMPHKNIYIDRGYTGRRRDVLNKEELLLLLRNFEYEVVDPSSLSYKDQLSIAQNSNTVLGVHGAQLINSILSKSLIELNSVEYYNTVWGKTMRKMCLQLNKLYLPYLSETTDENGSDLKIGDINRKLNCDAGLYQSKSFKIDILKLQQYLAYTKELLN